MSAPPDPTNPKSSSGIHVGDLSGERDVNVSLTDVAGGDQIKITNSPGATVIKEAPRKLSREEQLAQRNRQTMLLKVKAYWIDGVLANSLHSKVIPLDLERKPSAVTQPRPWDMLWQHRDQQPQPLPPGTRIIDRFNYAAGDALLILGEPGSGKTTMLLELAGELLEWAEQNEALRIPVVFNLSSWAVTRPPLTEWLVSELQTLYLIPKKVAQAWVEQDDILPLLDGLDEVAQEHRADCIKAINAYREAQGTPLVVCSRIVDYEAIGEKLLLSDGLLLRPLTQEQINEYLVAGGSALDGVRHAIQQDPELQEMAQSPLLLSLMAIAYRDRPLEQFTTTYSDDRRFQLFVTYLQRQLPQRKRDLAEDTTTTLCQLSYLANQMTACNQTIFLIERIQPMWLLTPRQQLFYLWAVGLSGGFVFGLGGWLGGGLVVGPVARLYFELADALIIGLVVGLFFALAIGVRGGLIVGRGIIKPVEKVNWSWRHVSRSYLILGLGFGLGGGVVGGLAGMLAGLMVGGMIGGLFNGLSGTLAYGFVGETVELKTTANEGIRSSLRNASQVGLVVGLVFGLIFGLFVSLFEGVLVGFMSGLLGGLIFGLTVGLVEGGGLPAIQHYTLRYYLHRYGYLPLNLVPFLDLAAERLILQKVGGGYRFVHRLLQEYLASLYVENGEG